MIKHLLGAAALMLATTGFARAEVDPLDLVEPIAEYKVYVTERTNQLVAGVTEFTDAVKAGEIERAKELFPRVRVPYEQIEPIAELFSDLDFAIDSRADDHEGAEQDPEFIGFHRLEYALWDQNSTEGMEPVADRLLADVQELHGRIAGLTFPPEKVVGGAAVLMEEVAATKISGEEDRYSHTDLWDFRANFDGAYKIVELVRPLIADSEGAFLATVDANFATVDGILEKYREGDGFVSYNELTDADRNVLAVAVNTLAEDLSTLRGKLGLD
ncbi:MAG: iron uptake system protein EfeO [Paracoccus sp. (in: a-proteobacteria)]|uniref:iron uptake system protein EfeO n=1 Tax=Paracoccus sp. TaxID=267 RepID=UPI0026DF8EFA|nr:iron uptake system protein EfeO [Paracoccus sp. (in: a-proteobacteria)]MDO5614484.1 iron uptake system protein EfeO [Paracoccus sp. (in: a-proteobacteria)]